MINTAKKSNYSGTIFVVAGGTAGHVFPAIEITNILSKSNVKVINITDNRAKKFYSKSKYLYSLNITSFNYRIFVKLIKAVLLMLFAVIKSLILVIKHRPICVIGFGGYPSAPMCLASLIIFRPLYLHEQNSILGRVNRIFSPFAKRVFIAFPNTIGGNVKNRILIGTPISSKFKSKKYTITNKEKSFKILITGGSLGASIFTDVLPKMVAILSKKTLSKLSILHQAPINDVKYLVNEYKKLGVTCTVSNFFDNMHEHLNWCHLYIGRAGGLTTAELMQVGRPSILVPLPFATDNHQFFNAHYLQQQKASVLIQQKNFSPNFMASIVSDLINNKYKLINMATVASSLTVDNPGSAIASLVLSDNRKKINL